MRDVHYVRVMIFEIGDLKFLYINYYQKFSDSWVPDDENRKLEGDGLQDWTDSEPLHV